MPAGLYISSRSNEISCIYCKTRKFTICQILQNPTHTEMEWDNHHGINIFVCSHQILAFRNKRSKYNFNY